MNSLEKGVKLSDVHSYIGTWIYFELPKAVMRFLEPRFQK